MIIHDISLSVSETLARWPSHPPIKIWQQSHLDKGDRATVSILQMCAHTGTHVDAPNHFIAKSPGVDSLDLNLLVGDAMVVDMSESDRIGGDELAQLNVPANTQRLILRTSNSHRWIHDRTAFFEDYVGITAEGAQWLVQNGIRLVGLDALSIASFDQLTAAHTRLLKAGITIVEGLVLHKIQPGNYQFVCLPLKLEGLDGAPARAILIET